MAGAKRNDKHYSVTRVAFPRSSESNGSDLPCVAAKKYISRSIQEIFQVCIGIGN